MEKAILEVNMSDNGNNEKHPLGTIFQVLFGIAVVLVAWEICTEGSQIVAWFGHQVMGLFDRGTIDPHDKRGFAKFAQLLLIAFFIKQIFMKFFIHP